MLLIKILRLWKHLDAFMFLVAHDHVLRKASNCKNSNEKLNKKVGKLCEKTEAKTKCDKSVHRFTFGNIYLNSVAKARVGWSISINIQSD